MGGLERTVLLHIPPNLAHPAALVLNLHGSGGTARDQEELSAMDALADEQGFIVAYPQAAIALGGGFAWNVPGQPLLGGASVPAGAADDSAFLAEAIVALASRYAIDPHRVYATGMSGGARMTSQVGCTLSEVVAAIAPVAGLRFPAPCTAARRVPVVSFHGTADAVNPYEGGGQGYWIDSVPSAAAAWAAHDACASPPASSEHAPRTTLTAYTGCAQGAEVKLYTIDGAGHEWPGAPGQTQAVDANRVMWRFFSSHPLSGER